jgi:hypothetical protein
VRLLLHTGAYWLMLKLRDAIPVNGGEKFPKIVGQKFPTLF